MVGLPPPAEWATAALITLVAAIVQGCVGFAFGILSMALLMLIWDPRTANVVVSLLTCWSVTFTLWGIRRWIRRRALVYLTLGLAVGLPLGTKALVTPEWETGLRALVAVACLLVAWQNWGPEPPPRERGRPAFGEALLAGLGSGFLAGSVSSGGPPIIWYVYRQPWSREEWKATTLGVFGVALLLKLAVWLIHDLTTTGARLYTAPRLWLTVTLLPAVLLGSWCGVTLFRHVDRALLRRLICWLLVLLAGLTVRALLTG